MLNNRCKPDKFRFADQLRRNPTEAEAALWKWLQSGYKRSDGVRFARQSVILGWIIDFYCASRRVAIEIDGGYHNDRAKEDARRDAVLLKKAKIITLKFKNEEVMSDPFAVASAIYAACAARNVFKFHQDDERELSGAPVQETPKRKSNPRPPKKSPRRAETQKKRMPVAVGSDPSSKFGWAVAIIRPLGSEIDYLKQNKFEVMPDDSAWCKLAESYQVVRRWSDYCEQKNTEFRFAELRANPPQPVIKKKKRKPREPRRNGPRVWRDE